MTLPPRPPDLTEEERQVLADKFDDHEIPEEQRERQEKYREKLDDSEQTSSGEDGDTRITDRVAVEDNGIRILCPRCDQPNVVERLIDTGTYAECAWDDCDAIVTYRVTVAATAVDSKERAEQIYEGTERDAE